jgi:hypothetical protein
MSMIHQAVQFAQRRVARKMIRAVPWLGSLLALITLRAAMRHKGVLRGAADTALDFTPYVGGVKNTLEVIRGRDFIRNKDTITRVGSATVPPEIRTAQYERRRRT